MEKRCLGEKITSNQHHKQGLSSQERFKNLCETMVAIENPFKEKCTELLALDKRNCAHDDVVTTVNSIEALGTAQCEHYVKVVIEEGTSSIHQPIKRNNLSTFKKNMVKSQTKNMQQVVGLKSDCNLFGQLYIASKFRDGNLDEFFSHENHPWPPALSVHGKLNLPSKKSDSLALLEPESPLTAPSLYHTKIFDGSVIVHALPTYHVSAFSKYADSIVSPMDKTTT